MSKTPSKSSFRNTAIVLSILFWATPVFAQIFDEDYTDDKDVLSARVEVGIYSDRILRGQNLYNGTSLQPKAGLTAQTDFGRFSARVFSHFSLEDEDPRAAGVPSEVVKKVEVAPITQDFIEADYELAYGLTMDMIDFELGHRWYTYDKKNTRLVNTAEFFGQVGLKTIAHPYIMGAYDYDKHEGWYYEAGVSEPFPLEFVNAKSSITPSLTIGASSGLSDDEHPIYDESGIAFVDVGVKTTLGITDQIAVEPAVHYSGGVDKAATDDFWFGVNLVGDFGL